MAGDWCAELNRSQDACRFQGGRRRRLEGTCSPHRGVLHLPATAATAAFPARQAGRLPAMGAGCPFQSLLLTRAISSSASGSTHVLTNVDRFCMREVGSPVSGTAATAKLQAGTFCYCCAALRSGGAAKAATELQHSAKATL